MKVQVLKKKGDKVTFVLDGATPAFANALRRVMISEVPTLAVEWVDMHYNSSILYDEIVAHRLAMIPLKFDPRKMNMKSECKCGGKGCSLCQVVFAADKNGPGNLLSGDLKSSNRQVAPTSPDFPVIHLLKGHNIRFEAIAEMGIGRNHSKWQAANASYQYWPEIRTEGKPSVTDIKKCVTVCPKNILVARGGKPSIKDPAECDLCMKCAEVCANVKMEGNPGKFIFFVESVSGLEPGYIVEKAAEIMREKAEEFKKKAGKL
jgi:DNA-directed RNA polymerase subunit D